MGWGVSKIKIKLFRCAESLVFGMLHYSLCSGFRQGFIHGYPCNVYFYGLGSTGININILLYFYFNSEQQERNKWQGENGPGVKMGCCG